MTSWRAKRSAKTLSEERARGHVGADDLTLWPILVCVTYPVPVLPILLGKGKTAWLGKQARPSFFTIFGLCNPI